LAQTSIKRRKILFASIIIAAIVISSIGTLIILYHQPSTAKQSPTKLYVNISLNQTRVSQGNNLKALVNVTSIGKAENVTLGAAISGSSITYSFGPSMGKSNFTSTLTLSVPYSTPTGNYTLTVIAFGYGQEQNASLVVSVYPQSGKRVTVTGLVYSGLMFPSSLVDIQFTDVQTGSKTSFAFFPNNYPPETGIIGGTVSSGNYSVVLINEHTYSVTITYYTGPNSQNASLNTESVGNFTVVAPAGETAISKDFAY
jgi:hypothetical protein